MPEDQDFTICELGYRHREDQGVTEFGAVIDGAFIAFSQRKVNSVLADVAEAKEIAKAAAAAADEAAAAERARLNAARAEQAAATTEPAPAFPSAPGATEQPGSEPVA